MITKRMALETIAVIAVTFLGLQVTIQQIPLVWDEGFTLRRLDALEPWFASFFDANSPLASRQFDADVLSEHWRFSRAEPDGHGPFYALLSLTGHWATGWLLGPPASYRVGATALFALTVGLVFATFRRRYGRGIGLVAAGLLATTPRVIPEVSFALIDGPLLCLAILSWCGFVRAVGLTDPTSDAPSGRRWPYALAFGLTVGLAMATKLTGWFLPLPYLAWALLTWRKDAVAPLAIGAVTALVTVFAINVGWWPDPVAGVLGYFDSNLTRAKTIPIETLFMGTKYPFSLPWYNTIVWTVIATPALALTLLILGVAVALRKGRGDPFGLLLVFQWSLLMVLRALPQAPGHDGTRQILIALGFAALLGGYGFAWLVEWSAKVHWKRVAVALLGVCAVGESLASVVAYHPTQLSYYGPLIGGLPGAERAGFEPTYFWDAVTPDVLEWLNANVEPGRCVLFRNNTQSWPYLRQWGDLRAETAFESPDGLERAQWVVYQNRPGHMVESDDWLLKNAKPAYERKLFGVWQVRVYSAYDWRRANAATRSLTE